MKVSLSQEGSSSERASRSHEDCRGIIGQLEQQVGKSKAYLEDYFEDTDCPKTRQM